VPPSRFLNICRSQFVPRVLTLEESARFLHSCKSLQPTRCYPLRGLVHGTALTLLLLTGLRVGEALTLHVGEVDLTRGLLHVHHAKFGKSRLVPMADDLTECLQDYHCKVDRYFGKRDEKAPFFPSPKGAFYTICALRHTFRKVLCLAGINSSGRGKRPRLHDLRHSFATNRLLLWYRQEADLNAKLPLLATYLGHVNISSSQRYLHLTQDMLGEIVRRHQTHFGHLIS
jgi:integrase